MVVWNWFINENLYNYEMDYKTSLMIILVAGALQLKMNTTTAEWEHEPWMYLFICPIAFGCIFLTSWIIKLIIL